MTEQTPLDNPYRFILVAGARTNQLLKGAKPRVKVKRGRKKPTFIALDELKLGKLDVTVHDREAEEVDLLSMDV